MPKYTEAEKKQMQEQRDFAVDAGSAAAEQALLVAWHKYLQGLMDAGMSQMVIANAKSCFLAAYRQSIEKQISVIRNW